MDQAAAAGMPSPLSPDLWAQYGLAGIVILVLFYFIWKGSARWVKSAEKREERDADERKAMRESLNDLVGALNRIVVSSERQSNIMSTWVSAISALPCTKRDPAMRTRASDRLEKVG